MFYRVTARLKPANASEFQRKLLDGTIAQQKPDGREIVSSMQRAVVRDSGEVEWSEVCYCSSPLRHERDTVYDHYFESLRTEAIDGHQTYQGRPFMDLLAELAEREV